MTSDLSPTKTVRPTLFYVLMVLAVIGMILTVSLSKHFYELRAGAASFKSMCNIGEKMNCDAVAASPYAELFYGIPLSSFATGWFLSILGVALFGLSAGSRWVISRALLVMTGFGLLMSAIYLYIMAAVIHTYCLECLGVDLINLLSFGTALLLWNQVRASAASGASRTPENAGPSLQTLAGVIAGCLFVSVVASKGMDQSNFKRSDVLFMAQDILERAPLPAGADEKYPSMGPKDASVTIVEFSDFQCPYCRLGAMELNTVMNRYPGKVRVVFRNYPLDPTCNRMMQHAGHPVACEAAKVGYCANQQGKFKDYYELTFDNQEKLAPGKPAEYAKQVGVDVQKLEACLKSPETQAAISVDVEEGTRLGVASTPTFFINGRKHDGGMPIPVWDAVLDKLIK